VRRRWGLTWLELVEAILLIIPPILPVCKHRRVGSSQQRIPNYQNFMNDSLAEMRQEFAAGFPEAQAAPFFYNVKPSQPRSNFDCIIKYVDLLVDYMCQTQWTLTKAHL